MARNDIKIASGGYGTREFPVDSRNNSGVNPILSGEPVKPRQGLGDNYTVALDDGDPTAGTDIFLGVAQNDSNETATASGVVLVSLVGPGTVIEGDAATGANIDTAAELAGLMYDFINFDVSATSVYTLDEDENGIATQLALCIVGGDTNRSRVFALVTKSLVHGHYLSV